VGVVGGWEPWGREPGEKREGGIWNAGFIGAGSKISR